MGLYGRGGSQSRFSGEIVRGEIARGEITKGGK